MRTAHISLLALLLYISRTHGGSATVSLTATLESAVRDEFYVACLSNTPDANECIQEWKTFDHKRMQFFTIRQPEKGELFFKVFEDDRRHFFNKVRGVEQQAYREMQIPFPWNSTIEPMFLLVRDSSGRFERLDVSGITTENNVIEGVRMFGALRLNFKLACSPHQYGPNCRKGCSSSESHVCDTVTGDYICIGNHFGEHCKEKYCLNGGAYDNSNCTCTRGWAGLRCDSPVPVDSNRSNSSSIGNGEDEEEHQQEIRHRAREERLFSILHYALMLLLPIFVLASALLAVSSYCRRTRKTRHHTAMISSLNSSLLSSDDSDLVHEKFVDYSAAEVI